LHLYHFCIFVLNNFGCNLPVGGTPASLYRLVACLVYFFPSRVRTKSSAVCAPVGNTCFFLNKCNISEFSVRPTNISWPVLCHRLEGTTVWLPPSDAGSLTPDTRYRRQSTISTSRGNHFFRLPPSEHQCLSCSPLLG
ncbi:hypothetical protein FKM82_017257, partial [Ascaphus truei]